MDLGIEGRVAVVTGASRGIGAAVADMLEAEGARVVRVSRGDGIDVTAPDAAERIAERAGARVDILVNNAGTSVVKALADVTDEEWYEQFELHVMASMRLMRAFAPGMAGRGWGRIVNVSSSAGKRPSSNLIAAYSVAKAAQLSLSRVYADAYAARGVLVNAVTPGPDEHAGVDRRGRARRPDGGGQGLRLARGGDRGARRQGAARALRRAGGDRGGHRVPVLGAGVERGRRGVVGRRRDGRHHRVAAAAARAIAAAAIQPPRKPSGTLTARPSAVPTCAAAFRTPEAMPCSVSPSAAVPDAVEATADTPSPAPMSTNAGRRAAGDCASSTSAPAPIAARPPLIAPRRASSDAAITARLNGAHQRPVSSGPRPSVSCW